MTYRLEVHVTPLLDDGVHEGQDQAILNQDVRGEEADPHAVWQGQRRPPLPDRHAAQEPIESCLEYDLLQSTVKMTCMQHRG